LILVKKKASFFKRKGMPTPDASQFTQMKKFQAIERRVPGITDKIVTHLYQPVVSTTGLPDFLPSFTNKFVGPKSYSRINVSTGKHSKPKIPGGNVYSGAGTGPIIVPPVTTPTANFRIYIYGNAIPLLPNGGPFGRIILNFTGAPGSTSLVFTFDTTSVPSYDIASVATYSPVAGTKIQEVNFGKNTITILTNPDSGPADVHAATINISSNDFNFEILSIN
jgi:hypothetical protein